MPNAVQTLFFPYELGVTTSICVTGFTMNQYPVDVATSLRGIETRTLLPGVKDKGTISFSMKDMEDIGMETVMQFYDLCKGPLLAFEIRDDHPIWVDGIPPFARYHWYPLWRFEGAISPTCTDCQSCSWDLSITLTNTAI
jgi:hypothetical protein